MRQVVIASPVQTQSGYGHHAREIIKNVLKYKQDDWDVKLLSLPWGGTPMTYPIADDWKSKLMPLPLTQQPDVWIQITVPNEFQPIGKYNVGVTAGTEGDICPEAWIDNLNAMQLILCQANSQKTYLKIQQNSKTKKLLL